MARKKRALRKNPSGLTIFLVVSTVASLAGGAWWFLKNRGSGGDGGAQRRVGVGVKEAFSNVRGSGAANLQAMKGGGGTLASLKSNTERAEKARARRDRILAERAAASGETSEELDLEGQRLDTSPPVG
jgi:hypothetical protein